MRCYRCNSTLDPKRDTCTKCGADVKMFRKIVYTSNRYYNEGLMRAQARDLTGARDALKTSLQLYKHNTNARNLLGLVYYAMGESAEGLKEWVISKNLSENSNIADRFINNMKRNMHDLDSEYHGIRKYNQALNYAKNDAKDLAVIQLKKVVSVHPNMTKAYELLALLYIEDEKYDQAKKVLNQCLAVDRGNMQAIRYLKELEQMTQGKGRNVGVVGEDDREQLIIPVRFRDYGTYLANTLYIITGLLLGIAIAWFVIVPGKVEKETGDAVAAARSYEAQISSLQEQAAATKQSEENSSAEESIASSIEESSSVEEQSSQEAEKELKQSFTGMPDKYPSWSKNNAAVPQAAHQNGTEEYSRFIETFLQIDGSQLSKSNGEIYQQLVAVALNPTNYELYLNQAEDMVKEKRYDEAAEFYDLLSLLHPEDPKPRYAAAKAYESDGNTDFAVNRYWQTAKLYSGTDEASEAAKKYKKLTGEKKLLPVPEGIDTEKMTTPLTYEDFGVEEYIPPETEPSDESSDAEGENPDESSENGEGESAESASEGEGENPGSDENAAENPEGESETEAGEGQENGENTP